MARIESMIEKQVDGYYYTNCGHTSKHLGHMKEHVEKHIEGLEYPCKSCDKILRSSLTFRQHITRFCPALKYSTKYKSFFYGKRLTYAQKKIANENKLQIAFFDFLFRDNV